MGALSIRDVRKSYHGNEILKGINLEIEKGEFLILVGPSGCGKSTLLSMIAGLDSVTSGEIRIGDRVVNDLSPKDRDIAMVFQSYALYPNMTVRENISFGLQIRKVPAAEQARIVERVANTLQIGHLLDRRPSQLSGGQRQRVAIARALIKRPRLVIADEPTASLDSHTADQVLDLMRERGQAEGAAFVIATHDERLTRRCDRVVALLDGRIQ